LASNLILHLPTETPQLSPFVVLVKPKPSHASPRRAEPCCAPPRHEIFGVTQA
jgi:hypothetical protein